MPPPPLPFRAPPGSSPLCSLCAHSTVVAACGRPSVVPPAPSARAAFAWLLLRVVAAVAAAVTAALLLLLLLLLLMLLLLLLLLLLSLLLLLLLHLSHACGRARSGALGSKRRTPNRSSGI